MSQQIQYSRVNSLNKALPFCYLYSEVKVLGGLFVYCIVFRAFAKCSLLSIQIFIRTVRPCHREIKDRDRITSFPPCTTISQKIDKEIRILYPFPNYDPQSYLIYLSIIIIYPLFNIYYPQIHLIHYENDLCL